MDTHYSGTLKDGFTSLANKNENGELTFQRNDKGEITDNTKATYTVAGKTINVTPVYKTTYTNETSNDQFNYLTNQWSHNSLQYTNMVDGLVSNDKYSNIVGALALGYKVEEKSGKEVWTFQLKEGVKWVDNKTGEEKGEVKADDFVASMEYVLNPANNSKTASIVTGVIDGAADYIKSLKDEDKSNDLSFDTVGIKAIDDYTLQYTLFEPTPYFMTTLTYSPFLPVKRDYLKQEGTDFGKTENNILVNGAFRMTKHERESVIELTKNDSYWDAKHVYVGKVVEKFVPSTATSTDIRKWYESGDIDGFSPNARDEEGYKKYVTGEDGSGSVKNPVNDQCNAVQSSADRTFNGFFNFNRTTYDYSKDSSKQKTAAQKAATSKALLNVNFRKGFLYGLDVLEYLKIYNPKAPIEFLGRTYTIRDLCTVDGKDYCDFVDEVYNKKQGTTGVSLTGINNGSDPIFDKAKATKYFQTAKQELLANGLTEADFPIRIDIVKTETAEDQPYETATFAPLREAGQGVVEIVELIAGSDDLFSQWVEEDANYDFNMLTGWGPDYADPKTFLHTYVEFGESVMYFGFGNATVDPDSITDPDEKAAAIATTQLQHEVLGGYTAAYELGAQITDASKLAERYQKFAEAEYKLIYEDALIIPWLTNTGWRASVSKVVPYAVNKASYGLSADKLSNIIVASEAINKDTRSAIKADYDSKK